MAPQAHISFDVDSIHRNFLDVQRHFHDINERLDCQRDFFDDEVIGNLLNAYRYVNQRLAKNPKKHMIDYDVMLELNAIVLTGIDPLRRKEYRNFLKETEKKSLHYIDDLMKWYERHQHSDDNPHEIAGGLYVRILAQPQLFIEGNHRTGALVANYHLLMAKQQPFILTTANAVEFFNLASQVKFQDTSIKSRFKRATGWHDEKARMSAFLKENANAFTCPSPPDNADIKSHDVLMNRGPETLALS